MNRVQFLELFDFIAAAFKGTTLKKKNLQKNNVLFFFGKGSQEVPETIQNQFETISIYPSVCFSFSPSLSLSYLSIDYILTISKMWITSITIALVSCCIGSLLDPFPVGLDKDVNGMRRSVTQQIYLKNLPSITSGSVGQQIRTMPK